MTKFFRALGEKDTTAGRHTDLRRRDQSGAEQSHFYRRLPLLRRAATKENMDA
jgi:hypothetical protein